ncbi:UvrD-helicase domain-containing protein [Chryseobacterium sp. C3]|uniref:UvrD-helicase domain-containing protein n=1 Tax=Chryseobacterium sp. C3 TaxID=2761532 RepID=UPI001625AD6A|nr:UvrD-helicase domain-containing protein [Chryseobacterium sp. C3]
MISYLIGSVVIATTVGLINNAVKEKKKKKLQAQREKEERDKLCKEFRVFLIKVKVANQDFQNLTNNENGYFSYYKLTQWKGKYDTLLRNNIVRKSYKNIGLSFSEEKEIEFFVGLINNAESHRENFNDEFLEYELKETQSLLSNIDGGKSLDNQQREAILRDEDNSLVIAGAGCGKTTTIMGKVNYLNKRLKISPEEILLISFTKKSAEDLANKVNIKGIDAKTFHKLGLDIIKDVEKAKTSLYDQEPLYFLKDTFKKLSTNEKYLNVLTKYFTDFIKISKDDFEFNNQAEHIQHLKDQNFRPYKKIEINVKDKVTVLREIVKSQEECKIANFLLFNGLDYRYEEPYEIATRDLNYRQYQPDFSLYQEGKRIYLEHYALDKNGNVPPFFANENISLADAKIKYHEGIQWKRKVHEENGTICIETFSYQFKDGSFEENLIKTIKSQGFLIKPLTEREKWELIQENASDEVESLIALFNTFLSLYKSTNITYEELQNKIKVKSGFDRQRCIYFVALFYPLYQAYEAMLKRKQQIDFSDMINQAVHYIETKKYVHQYKYLIIDEFQDISTGRYKLINAFKKQRENVKLFAVGDDWQSIYRFTGSDISLFNNFEEYFGFTNTSKIETTYRFGLPMIEISGRFVMKNPAQIEKHLKNKSNVQSDLEIFYTFSDENDDSKALEEAIIKVIKTQILNLNAEPSEEEIKQILSRKYYLLGRYNHDFNRIKPEQNNFKIIRENTIEYKYSDRLKIELEFFTAHRSKGLEAEYVFVLNCNSGRLGFPSEMYDDPVLLLLLGESESYPNSEERRLFYVALTRAKLKTSLIANKRFASKFIQELERAQNSQLKNVMKCPRCESGDLELKSGEKNNRKWAFYGCSNFAVYDCQYRKWLNDAEIELLHKTNIHEFTGN